MSRICGREYEQAKVDCTAREKDHGVGWKRVLTVKDAEHDVSWVRKLRYRVEPVG